MTILNREEECVAEIRPLVWDIQKMWGQFVSVQFNYISQSFNGLAHKLARSSLGSATKLWISQYPNWIVSLATCEKSQFVLQWGLEEEEKKKKKKTLSVVNARVCSINFWSDFVAPKLFFF